MADSLTIRRLTQRDVEEAGDLLARAFFDYPMLTWLMPDDAHRRVALPISMRVSVRWGLMMDETFGIGDPLRGVAVWAPPGMSDSDLDPEDAVVRYHEAAAALGAEAEARYDQFVAEQRILRERDMGSLTWYLSWLAVEPAHQRSGAGGALLNDMFTRLDVGGHDVYLETEKDANVAYYHRYGFMTVAEGTISNGGPRYWTFRRSPPL